ncbi:hypothetical protein KYLE_14 [Pantoea phage Kyle]|uniref:Uncharacterized protein n=1 Tax=Pantoea phage Kyle TaxID=2589665 RepID=A0A514A8I4_9CAUD|nr:hypothetical protein HWC52_gp014 [Pantoea phage Kyle]QDH49583.1 hypothetical protein KYLE_14 [Pantoea phage Kyle]
MSSLILAKNGFSNNVGRISQVLYRLDMINAHLGGVIADEPFSQAGPQEQQPPKRAQLAYSGLMSGLISDLRLHFTHLDEINKAIERLSTLTGQRNKLSSATELAKSNKPSFEGPGVDFSFDDVAFNLDGVLSQYTRVLTQLNQIENALESNLSFLSGASAKGMEMGTNGSAVHCASGLIADLDATAGYISCNIERLESIITDIENELSVPEETLPSAGSHTQGINDLSPGSRKVTFAEAAEEALSRGPMKTVHP